MNAFDFLMPMLEDAVRDGCFPSACLAVGAGDTLLFQGAAGDARLGTLFDMASLTKILAPTMIALLALERGELRLADQIGRFFPDAPADKRRITLLQLMTHTGGFEPSFLLEAEAADLGDATACILRHPLAGAPDGTPRYSCMGYILLGKILETACGCGLDALARGRVFAPLGMTHTGYLPQGGDIAPTEMDPATGAFWRGIVHDENARFLGGVAGNAGVFSNLPDMLRFARMLAAGGRDLLSSATLSMATRNYTKGQAAHRGLGFQLGGTPDCFMGELFPESSFGHTGFTGTSLVVDPGTGLFVILLTNRVHPTRDNPKLLQFRRLLHNTIYANFMNMR